MKRIVTALGIFILLASGLVQIASAAETETLPITQWLRLGPVSTPLPAFNSESGRTFTVENLLDAGNLDPKALRPRAGRDLILPGAGARAWTAATAAEGSLTMPIPDAGASGEAWLAVYITADRWQQAELKLSGEHPALAILDGEQLTLSPAENDAERKAELKLTIGKHLLLVRTVYDPEKDEPWEIGAALERNAEAGVELTIEPTRSVDIRDILDAPKVSGAVISPDGSRVACRLGAYGPDGEQENWYEIRDTRDGSLERTWRGSVDARDLKWAPGDRRLSYVSGDEKSTIWLYDIATGEAAAAARDIEKLEEYKWAPDGSYLIYSFGVEPEKDERDVHHLRDADDRLPWYRNRSYLVQVVLPDGASRQLTAGDASAQNWRISPDGRSLIFFREYADVEARPYYRTELWRMDLGTLQTVKITEGRWIGSAEWSPDGRQLAILGSPSSFDGIGNVLAADVLPNEYGGQLFIYDIETGDAAAITRDFAPQISSCVWHPDGRIYALALSGQYQGIYSWDGRKWSGIDCGVDYVSDVEFAAEARTAVARGTSAAEPQKLLAVDLKKGKSRVLLDPGASRYGDIEFGRVEDWKCELPNGELMDGRVHYPVGYDPELTYPVIVYYYGGTSPITRDFGGRYPKNVWTSQGYFVYVPEPSGATGYGQEFAARHVNDWGRLTAPEVIEGTKAFLKAFPAADPERVGCMGASYGGFLTEYLVTRTDIFACGISHAGISSISSYWGEGYWGYVYGARALAEAFPWSDRELYVEQSPLFHADKIHTPLLLLHGGSDTNVPRGESDQLFVALKLLGRDVEYVRINGQDHWILDHDQRIVWNDTIMAYFAKYLKGRPAWWNEMYPED